MGQSFLPVSPGSGDDVATDDVSWASTTCKAQMVKVLDATPGSTRLVNAAITPAAGNASSIVTGGTAVAAIEGPVNGGYIVNPFDAAAQGLGASEELFLDMVATPGSTQATANGTTIVLFPGDRFDLPYALANGVNVQVNAASAGHKFTAVQW